MKSTNKGFRSAFLAVALASILIIPTAGFAQARNRGGGHAGSGGGHSFAGRAGGGRGNFGHAGFARSTAGRSSFARAGAAHGSFGRTSYGRTSVGRTSFGRTGYGGTAYKHGGYGRTGYGGTAYAHGGRTGYGGTAYAHSAYGGYGRAQGFAPRVGVRMGADQWRQYHPDWNGHYYWHNGGYFFDPLFQFPAIVTNTWGDILLGLGGVAIGASLVNDPYIYFSGPYGELFPTADLSIYLGSSDPVWRARAAFFNRPYFYRDGVRFDRESVARGGRSYYRFVRR